MLKIETIAKNFKIFWSLQVRTCVYAYRMLRAWRLEQGRFLFGARLGFTDDDYRCYAEKDKEAILIT